MSFEDFAVSRAQRPGRSFGRGGLIFEAGDPVRSVYRIVSGWARLQVFSAEGERRILGFAGPGDSVGAWVGEHAVTAEAVTAVETRAYDVKAMLGLLGDTPGLAAELMSDAERRYSALAHHVNQLQLRAAPQRVLCFLAWIARREPRDKRTRLVRLPMSRDDIGDFLNVAPATLSRIMTKLRDDRRIDLEGPRNFSLRVGGPFVEECYGAASCAGCTTDGDLAERRCRQDLGADDRQLDVGRLGA